ncbi:MAG: hypothetical protein HYR76_07965 [Ignavibacteria bacterium]|nr:hypothetical protein [Ignavibacteria bacterium]
MKTCIMLFVVIVLIALQSSYAQIPRTLSYQSVLTDNAGTPKPNGSYLITFRLYAAVNGGVALWTESQTLQVKRGLFSAVLGSITPIGANLTFAEPYWLSLQVAPDAEMSPRLPLTSVAYSFNSILADGQVVRSINNLHDVVTLQAQGGATITSNGNTLTINAGSGGGGTGIQGIQNTDNTLTILNPNGPTATVNVKDPLVLNGNVGIGGTPAVGVRLEVDGPSRFAAGGSGGFLQIGTPNGETGFSINGASSRADVRFDGSALKLVAGLVTGPPPSTSGMAITTAGNVGIGITAPTSKLEIIGQDALLVVGYQPFMTLSDANSGYKHTRLQNANGDLFIENEDNILQGTSSMVIKNGTGYVGIGTPNPTAKLEVIGRTKTGSLEITAGNDLAEPFDIESGDVAEPGSIMVIDALNTGKLKLSELPYDAKVAGIVSGAGGVKPGITLQQEGVLEGKSLVAIAGRVYCKADANEAPIEPGDLLTTSSTPGHAMKATDKNRSNGAIIGKAMSSLKKGTGLVLVLVNLQ